MDLLIKNPFETILNVAIYTFFIKTLRFKIKITPNTVIG